MGHSLATPVSLPSAPCRAVPPRIFTTTLLPTLAVPSGGFDTPKAKCPPPGSSEYVTGILASSLHANAPHHKTQLPSRHAYPSPPSPNCSSLPKPIPTFNNHHHASFDTTRNVQQLATPPLTPESSFAGEGATKSFLTTLFPRSGVGALKYAKNVQIASTPMEAAWEGVVLEMPGQAKTLYVNGKGAEQIMLRESIVALLDLADERLGCSALVIALDRSCPQIGSLLHSLMYVGGTVVTKPPFKADAGYILVGIEM